ncbi:MAG: gluconate 2-dehydrogenase subunit 3 family protein [Bacteroidetes bacterium]|nr:gluconate 2-dehydrogenase subunit 3 family protein [Bacteroidota bacterium]MBS1931852.1 gluconate 2-dehydrogenase subunit 3 family protein [Bacteroidota bacterium]
MNRRELLKMIAMVTGGAVIGSEFLLDGCQNPSATMPAGFTADEIAFLNEVAETILPATQTPGAKAANVGQFMAIAVNDCYTDNDQKIFHTGMQKLKDACQKKYHTTFMKASPEQKKELLIFLDKVAIEYQKMKNDFDRVQDEKEKEEKTKGNNSYIKEQIPSYYFTMMKQLTLWGFFTSKEGMTQALKYIPVPGRYNGCMDYQKGDKIMVGLTG